MKYFLLSLILDKKVLRGVDLAVTYKCQAKCVKCSCRNLIDDNRDELSKEQILEICRQSIERGALFTNLTGGEPLLREDIYEIINELTKLPLLISLSTNALLLSPNSLKRLKNCGLHVVQVSLCSPFAREHDREIGTPGSYNKAIQCIKIAKRLSIEVFINFVVTRESIYSGNLDKMAKIAKKNYCYLSLVLPAKVGGWDNQQVNLNQKDYEMLKDWLKFSYVVTDTESCYDSRSCPAGKEKVYISPYGDLYPCPFIHTNYGNLFEFSLNELWRLTSKSDRNACANIVRK